MRKEKLTELAASLSLFGPKCLRSCVAVALCTVLLPGCGSEREPAEATPKTTEKSSEKRLSPKVHFSSVKFPVFNQCKFSNGKEADYNGILEIVGGGVGCIDYDRDGVTDLFFPRGGKIHPDEERVSGINSTLLRGLVDLDFSDATERARFDTSRIYSHGVSAADFDHDGFQDLLVYGYGGVVLLQNQGDGTFSDVTQHAGLLDDQWVTSVAWIDLDDDGHLDLYFGSYVDWSFEKNVACTSKNGKPDVCSPNVYEGSENTVYRNLGTAEFTEERGRIVAGQPGKSLGALSAEFFGEQGVGLYVANDLVANFLFTRSDQAFLENAIAAGVAVDDGGVANGSMGIALLDFNLDKRFDIFVTNFEHEQMALYLNSGTDAFHHSSRRAGLNRNDLRVVGFGVVAADFDGDSDEDILYTSGHVQYFPDSGSIKQLPGYLENDAGRRFVKPSLSDKFFSAPDVGRGLATADFNADGKMDAVATDLFAAPTVLMNLTPVPNHWLTLELIGKHCSRTPVGAIAEVTVGDQTMVRQLVSGGSYLSQSQQILHFAWPRTIVDAADGDPQPRVRVSVHWPGGEDSCSETVSADQHLVMVQGAKPK